MPSPSAPPPSPGEPAGRETQPRLKPPAPDETSPGVRVGGSVGGDAAGRDLHKTTTAGRDVVGGDVVSSTTFSTTHFGVSIEAVQRLVITVGLLVFATAFCFFSSGFLLGGAALAALNRPVASSEAAAQRFASGLSALQALPAGEVATFTFTEDEISSYFRFVIAPRLGRLNIQDGKVRLLGDERLVVGGRSSALAGLPFAATFELSEAAGRPLVLQTAAVRLLPTGTPFGWVIVPSFLLRGLEQSLNALFGNVQILDSGAADDGDTWVVTVVGH